MKKILFLLLLITGFSAAKAQLIVNNTLTPQQLVQTYLVGNGVAVSNVTFNGAAGTSVNPQIGFFDATATTIGTVQQMNTGLILASGQVTNAVGPNNTGSVAGMMGGSGYDADLDAICIPAVYDMALLEFDFVPAGDTVKFSFIFASDEYIEYVGGGINDAFGIFISGPGIAGPFSNGGVNMATVPGTALPISIDNISPFTNAMYYVDNGDGFTAPYNTNPQYIQYDGHTVKITASYPVQCGQTYHIKFGIGDGADDFIDSGVFLEAGSFSSNGVNVSLITPTLPNATQGVVYEGCLLGNTVDFTFVRPDTMNNDTVFFNLGGNAVNGTDYTLIPTNYIVFPNGQDSVTLTITVPNDFVTEGVDTLIITTIGFTACGTQSVNSAVLYIHDPYELIPFAGNDTVYSCPGQVFTFNGITLNGNPPYNYSWSNAVTGQNITYTITQLGGDTLVLSVTDGCGYIGDDTLFLSHIPPVPLTVDAGPDTTLTCAGQSVVLQGTVTGMPGVPVSYQWSNGANTASTVVQPLVTTSYVLSVSNTCLQSDTDTLTVFVPPFVPLSLFVSDTLIEVQCAGDTATFTAYVSSGGQSPYSYIWSTMDTDSVASFVVTAPATYYFTASDACGLDTTIAVSVGLSQSNLNLEVSSGRHCRNSDSTALVPFTLSGGVAPLMYSWTTPAGVGSISVDTLTFSFLIGDAQDGMYVYTVIDACGISDSDSSSIIMINCAIDIPNVISPNADGLNDVFHVEGLQYHPNSILRVYNRWGQMVHYDANYQNNWDGGSLPAGTYFYIIELTDGTVPAQYHGTLTILY